MKTIAEVCGGETVDWRKELKLAKRRKKNSFKNIRIRTLSGSWTSCAVAQQDFRLAFSKIAPSPRDPLLGDLGSTFCREVNENLFDDALKTLDKIEDRAKVLLEKYEN